MFLQVVEGAPSPPEGDGLPPLSTTEGVLMGQGHQEAADVGVDVFSGGKAAEQECLVSCNVLGMFWLYQIAS